ncbi:MAG: YggT family protein [Anaerolineae bacterium]
MEPARRLIPPFGGLDISPILVLFALQLLESVLLRVLS